MCHTNTLQHLGGYHVRSAPVDPSASILPQLNNENIRVRTTPPELEDVSPVLLDSPIIPKSTPVERVFEDGTDALPISERNHQGLSLELTDLVLMYIVTVEFQASCGGCRELLLVLLHLRNVPAYRRILYVIKAIFCNPLDCDPRAQAWLMPSQPP